MKEEFKVFVRKKPELIGHVNGGEMTWQRFYEIWSLYGEDEKVWEKYKETKTDTKATTTSSTSQSTDESFSFSSLVDTIKKVDMNSVQKGIGSLQKAIELFQGISGKGTGAAAAASTYQPRQLFKKFED